MDAPRALGFRPLVKENEALGTRLQGTRLNKFPATNSLYGARSEGIFSAEGPWVLEWIRIPSDACGRANSTGKFLHPERKSCGFKNIYSGWGNNHSPLQRLPWGAFVARDARRFHDEAQIRMFAYRNLRLRGIDTSIFPGASCWVFYCFKLIWVGWLL